MENVPNIISTKDLSYICDMFQWNFITAKKVLDYSKNVVDKEIKKEFENLFDMHKEIACQIINILSGGKNE